MLKNTDSVSASYKKLSILNIDELIEFELAKFMYLISNSKLPKPLLEIFSDAPHQYHTRSHTDPQFHSHTMFCSITNSFLCKGPNIWSRLPVQIRNSSNLKSFAPKLKKYLHSI